MTANSSEQPGRGLSGGRVVSHERAARLMRTATYASAGVAGSLIILKLWAWLATDSIAVLSSLVDSGLDAAASLVNLIAVRHALMPADREHRFGHGKAEALAGLGQAAFVSGSAVFLLFEAISRFVTPRPVAYGEIGIGVMVVSIVVTLALVQYQKFVVRRTGSTAINADSLHYRADLAVNAGIIVGLILVIRFDQPLLDPIVAVTVAFYILYGAWQIVRESYDVLMDREFPDSERTQILAIAGAHPEVKGVHDLRTRRSGMHPFIQFHLELDGELSLIDAHIISDQVEADVRSAFPGAEIIIHQDPEGVEEPVAQFGC